MSDHAGTPNIAAIAEKQAPEVVYLYVYDLEAERDRYKAALTAALEDVWAVESNAAGSLSHMGIQRAREKEKAMLQQARHRIEAALSVSGRGAA